MPTNPRRIMAVLLLPLFMALVSVSVVNVGLHAIEQSVHATSQNLQWVLAGYALTFGLLLVPAGRVGDATGRKRMLMVGVAVFTLGGTLSGVAQSPITLNIYRVIQGIGAGLMNPQTSALIQYHFRDRARAKAFAAMGTTVAIATAIGPVIGGLLIGMLGDNLGWRCMFLINLPLGIIALILAMRWLPDDKVAASQRPYLDLIGAVILVLTVIAIMLPFFYRRPWYVWLLLIAGAVLTRVFIAWERHVKDTGKPPMVNMNIFRDEAFRNGVIIITVYFVGATSTWIVIPMFLQAGTGRSALTASMVSLPASLMAAVSSQWAGRHVFEYGRTMVAAGFGITLLGLIGAMFVAAPIYHGSAGIWPLMLVALLMGVGQGMTVSPNQTLTLRAVDPRFGGVAGGLISLGQRVGTAVGAAMIPGVLFGVVETGGSWLHAFVAATSVICVTTAAAGLLSLYDRRREVRDAALA